MKFRKVIPKATSERETTITISDWEEDAHVFSGHPYVVKKLDSIVELSKTARVDFVNDDGSKGYKLDKRHFSLNPKAHSPRKVK